MNQFYRKYGKRLLDIIGSLLGLILLFPLNIIIGAAVYIDLGSPVIFQQERPGKHGKLFTLYKFRSMTNATDAEGKLLPNKKRLTKFGQFIRATSIDELPELWNILIGEMSFVGPRPLLKEYLPLYNKEQQKRHNVRPGLTGYAQVNSKMTRKWHDKFAYDIAYVNQMSLRMDFKIIIATCKALKLRYQAKYKKSLYSKALRPFKGEA